jgi:hypothetical protein
MKRAELEHLIRAASAITRERDLVIVGSQAILGSIPDAPIRAPELVRSLEADMYPLNQPDLADLIEGALGALSSFDSTFGYYADGVGPETAILPAGWQDRLVAVETPATGGGRGLCLEVHDLAISKLAAGREKDLEFVESMLAHRFTNTEILRARLRDTDRLDPAKRPLIQQWLGAREPRKE